MRVYNLELVDNLIGEKFNNYFNKVSQLVNLRHNKEKWIKVGKRWENLVI